MIDVSYRYRAADLKGGKMMMDPETGIITLEGVPVDEHVEMPLPKDFGMTIKQEEQFEQNAKPTAPVPVYMHEGWGKPTEENKILPTKDFEKPTIPPKKATKHVKA